MLPLTFVTLRLLSLWNHHDFCLCLSYFQSFFLIYFGKQILKLQIHPWVQFYNICYIYILYFLHYFYFLQLVDIPQKYIPVVVKLTWWYCTKYCHTPLSIYYNSHSNKCLLFSLVIVNYLKSFPSVSRLTS